MQLALQLILQWYHTFLHSVLRRAKEIQCHYSVKQLLSFLLTSTHSIVEGRDILELVQT